jgi:thiamine pyrophosphokinase
MSEVPRPLVAAVFLDGLYEEVSFYATHAAAADVIVAADGAAAFLAAQGIRPDVVVGDFDSLAPDAQARLAAAGVEVLRFPVHKDVTDGELAVDEALRRGAGVVLLAGGLGALDHTLGHLAILRRLAGAGVAARLVSPQLTVAVLIASSARTLDAPPATRVSLVPLGGDAVVTLHGLEYPLTHEFLPGDTCLGLGNVVVGTASIVVHQGAVAVLVASGGETFGHELLLGVAS